MDSNPGMDLIVPETLKGGELLHLYKDYDKEMWLEAQRLANFGKAIIPLVDYDNLKDKVCFLCRTAQMHDIQLNRTLVETTVDDGIEGFVSCKCLTSLFSAFLYLHSFSSLSPACLFVLIVAFLALLRQTDPNWEAFFFITDDRPFEKRLQEILSKFNDKRVTFLDIPMKYRPKVSTFCHLFASSFITLRLSCCSVLFFSF
jgi:hypothetical protein